jgi:hypothetical protein
VLPNSHYAPIQFFKFAPNEPVAILILTEFACPKYPICSGKAAVKRTTVPKASIHKNGHTLGRKDEVGFAKYCGATTPPFYPIFSKDAD